jgi:hypothetical protein
MNQAHEQITRLGSPESLIEERVFPVQNRDLQGTFDQIIVEWRVWFAQKQRQLRPVPQ